MMFPDQNMHRRNTMESVREPEIGFEPGMIAVSRCADESGMNTN